MNFFIRSCILILSLSFLQSCASTYVRLPSSVAQVYSNAEVQQSLLLAAQNNVMIYIPEATTREFEKSEIDQACRVIKEPLWSGKLSIYLNEFRKRPELLNRLHVIEMKRGDKAGVFVQHDLDGAVTISIQFVKQENYGKVSYQSQLPCKGSIAEYLGRELIKTDYDFPDVETLVLALQALPEKKDVPRFKFDNTFLTYLAERGTIYKFSHEMSFEKTAQGKYIMAELLSKLGAESKQPFHQHMNYWFKQINEKSTQARLIQLFAALQDKELKAGVRVDTRGEVSQKIYGDSDLTYLYITYFVDDDKVNSVTLHDLDNCLQNFTQNMSAISLRRPADTEKESFLRPGYSCLIQR